MISIKSTCFFEKKKIIWKKETESVKKKRVINFNLCLYICWLIQAYYNNTTFHYNYITLYVTLFSQKQPFPPAERVSVPDLPTFALWAVSGPLSLERFSLWMCLKLGIMAQDHSICWGLMVAWYRRLSKANNIEAGWDMTKNAVMMLTSFQAQLPFESDHFKQADLWWMDKVLTDTEPPTLKCQYYYSSYF